MVYSDDRSTGFHMPTIFDLLYREYCRARLADMRKQLWLWPGSHDVPQANCDTDHPDSAADPGSM
jgi:hypothetical protein